VVAASFKPLPPETIKAQTTPNNKADRWGLNMSERRFLSQCSTPGTGINLELAIADSAVTKWKRS
jgi:hypothetical protein